MYRAITLYFLQHRIDWNKTHEVVAALKHIVLDFQYNPNTGKSDMYLNHEDVEIPIREMPVSDHVSAVSAVKEVREFGVAQQQLMGKKKGIVMDGRDIGTTVFPDAELKIFVVADPAIRVERRFKEMYEKNPHISIEDVKNNLESRDYIDSHREVSPLRKAADAIELDNSNLTREEQLAIVLEWSKDKISQVH
jgi:cytidylate kinase